VYKPTTKVYKVDIKTLFIQSNFNVNSMILNSNILTFVIIVKAKVIQKYYRPISETSETFTF